MDPLPGFIVRIPPRTSQSAFSPFSFVHSSRLRPSKRRTASDGASPASPGVTISGIGSQISVNFGLSWEERLACNKKRIGKNDSNFFIVTIFSRSRLLLFYLVLSFIDNNFFADSISFLYLNRTVSPLILPNRFPSLNCFFISAGMVLSAIASAALSVK